MKSLMISTAHPVLCGWYNREEWDGLRGFSITSRNTTLGRTALGEW